MLYLAKQAGRFWRVIGDDTEWDFAIWMSYTKLPFCLKQFDNSAFLKVEDDAAEAASFLRSPSYRFISVKFLIQEENIEIQISQNQGVS